MVARSDRNRPLPDAQPGRVDDSKTQRALDAISTPLRAILQFLQPFVQPEKWQPVTYQTGWEDFSRLEFKKSPLKRVYLQGSAQRTSGSSTVICVLPIGYRPALRRFFGSVVYDGANYITARIDVDVDGRVLVASGAYTFVPLDHINFEAA